MKKRTHAALGLSARNIRSWLKSTEGLSSGEDIVFLADVLSFLIHDTPAQVTDSALVSPREMYSFRKLKAAIELLEKFHELHTKPVATSDSE